MKLGILLKKAARGAGQEIAGAEGREKTIEVTDIDKFKAMILKRKGKKLVVVASRQRAS